MQDPNFIIKIAVLAVYVGILFLIGILASRRIKSMSDYYVGGKKMGFWAVAFSARATGEFGCLSDLQEWVQSSGILDIGS